MCTICGSGSRSRAEGRSQPGQSWAPCSENRISNSVETGGRGVSEAEYGYGVEWERPGWADVIEGLVNIVDLISGVR